MKLKPDLSNLDAILDDFDNRLSTWKDDVAVGGKNIERANMEQPAYFAYYDQIKAEAESLCEKLELMTKVAKAVAMDRIGGPKTSKVYPERTLDKLAEEDFTYRRNHVAYLEARERYLKAKSVVDAFTQRGYSLTNIRHIRIAEMHDKTIYEKS